MSPSAQSDLFPAREAAGSIQLAQSRSGLRYGTFGELETTGDTIERIAGAVPQALAQELRNHAFVFVPLVIGETQYANETEVARTYSGDLADRASCHRTVPIEGMTYTFISTRLMQDRFALAFEMFINAGHQYVDQRNAQPRTEVPALPERFTGLLWRQALADVRGETSQDSYEARKRAIEKKAALDDADGAAAKDARAQCNRFFDAAFSDALAIYMLSLAVDFDYADLREREYPLLSAPALADRLRLVAELFPPPSGYDFSIRYRRRH